MPPARRRLFIVLGCAVFVGGPVRAANAQNQRDANPFADILEQAAQIHAIPPERVVRFTVRDKELAVASEMKLADGARTLRVRGLEGLTRVRVGRQNRRMTGLSPFFELTYDGTTVQCNVYAQGSSVRLSRNVRDGDLYTTVSFSQGSDRRGRPLEEGEDRVSLRVRTTSFAQPQAPLEDVRVSAASFADLLRQHPAHAARHLAPLFRDFGQDAIVFRVDSYLAWQVFPEAAKAEEATVSKARALIARLDSDDFRERELATAELEVLGGPAVAVLNECDRSTLTPEQIARVDAILARHTQLDEAEVAALLDDTEFLLRCYTYSEVAALRGAAVRVLEEKTGTEPGLSPEAGHPARVQAADAFRARAAAGQRPLEP